MKRSVLSPEQSAVLAGIFARNSRFAGMRMMADENEGGDGDKGGDGGSDKEADADKSSDNEGGTDDFKSEESKARVMADLASERDARKALKAELDSMKDVFAKAAGIEVKEGDKNEDVLTAVQQELAAMRLESEVLKLANANDIKDDKDLQLLMSVKDPEARKALAERLAPAEEDTDAKSRGRRGPKPDRTQGGGDGSGAAAGGSVAAKREELEAARAAKKKTNS